MRVGRYVLALSAMPLIASAIYAQDLGRERMPPAYRGVANQVGGVFVTPVPNSPFSAEVQILSHEKLPDGTEHVVTTTVHIARASSGRIYNERRTMVPTDFKGTPRLLGAHVYDPNTRVSLMLLPREHLVRQTTLRAPEAPPAALLPPALQHRQPGVEQTDLGIQKSEGLELQGTRKQRTIPAEASGTGKPVVITDDYWYSPALSMYMTIRHDDPRTGEQLVAITKVERAEPPAQTFVFPADYKVVDETTAQAPVAAR